VVWVPGFQAELPIFNWNPGGVGRAHAELERAAHRYALVRQTILNEVRVSHAQLLQARASLKTFRDGVLPALTEAADAAQKGFAAGELPYLQVLDSLRRLADARLRLLDLEAEVARATAELERNVGKQGVVRE
jgi:cobalt-zinc-cadmium efflux system outer membrane protein